MNENLNKKSPLDAVKRFLFDNKVIIMFVLLSIACIAISGANISYIAGEVFSRFGRNTCLVLALIIPCMAGLGMNFGIVVGAIAAQISIFWVVHWGFTGIGGFLLCVAMSTPMAIFFGWLLGKLFNKTKGAEMIAGLVLGFFAGGLYRLFVLYIMGGVIPFDDPNLLDRGFGLRNAFDLSGNLKYAVDDISFLTTAAVLGAVFALATVVLALHDKKMGKAINTKSVVIKLAVAAAVIAFSVVGKFIPPVAEMLGKNRVILADAVVLGSCGALLYAIVLFLMKRPEKGSKLFNKLVVIAGVAVVLFVSDLIPGINKVYRSVRIPTMTYAVIAFFAFFNNWLVNTRLGQNMRTVGQNRAVATSAGLDVDKTRIIATCISTVLAAWGQLIFLQNLGTFNTVQQQDNVGLYAVAAILVGGANVQKATNKQAIIGVILFHTLFVVAPLAATQLVGDSAISEYIRMFFSYGVIAVSLAMHAWKSGNKRNPSAEGMTAVMMQPAAPAANTRPK
ncbi:MAG: ABC transporter permease [Oscillospiraceae bacterium]|nr:ABC transporter permease [Oscillospiraceae bacterium]